MRLHLSVLVAAFAFGALLASHANAASENDGYVTVRISDEMKTADKKAPVAPSDSSVVPPTAASGANWIEAQMAKDWWKDN